MHTQINRRTATKVKDGKVQRKNRLRPTGQDGYVLDRESPGRGCHHVISKRDIFSFIEIIPNWQRFSERLERIVLASNGEDADGEYAFYHREETGAIYLRAWNDELWTETSTAFFDAHQLLFERLGVSYDRSKNGVACRFTEEQARAYMLLHVFMHELGHHHDRTHQKHLDTTKGEDYAERFANSRFDELFPAYVRVFGDPTQGKKSAR